MLALRLRRLRRGSLPFVLREVSRECWRAGSAVEGCAARQDQAEELNADLLKARDGQARALLAAIAELGLVRAELTDKDAELAERDAALRGRDAELAQRDAALREAREIIARLRGVRGLVDFGSSEFKREYDRARQPEFQDQLLAAVREVVFDYAESKGLPHAETVVFLQQLQSEWSLTDSVGKAVQRLWTSSKRLGGVGLD